MNLADLDASIGKAVLAKKVAPLIRSIADYPRNGVDFKDITPLLRDARMYADSVKYVAALAKSWQADVVAGMEARGFLIGGPAAISAGLGFVPLRKPGKLPFAHLSEDFELEYGKATLEMHTDAIKEGARVLVVDDILATGGTASASARLIERAGGELAGLSFIVELTALGGRSGLADYRVDSLLSL